MALRSKPYFGLTDKQIVCVGADGFAASSPGTYTDCTGTRISKRGMRVETGWPSAVTPK